MNRAPRISDQGGFSLVELMVVVAIIAVLMGVAVPAFLGLQWRAQDRGTQSSLRDAFTAARSFHTDRDSYANFDADAGEDIEHTLQWADGPANAHRQVNIEAVTATEVTLTMSSSSGKTFCIADSSTAASGVARGIGDATSYADCLALEDW